MKAPWWMCNGWRSPWCVLDIVTRCKVDAICERHDRWFLKAGLWPEEPAKPTVPWWWSNGTTTSTNGSTTFTYTSGQS